MNLDEAISAYRSDIEAAWAGYPDEIGPFLEYIRTCSDKRLVGSFLASPAAGDEVLIALGGRLGEGAIGQMVEVAQRVEAAGGICRCFINESHPTSRNHPHPRDASELAEELRASGFEGEIIVVPEGSNTGDQAVSCAELIAERQEIGETVIVAASVEHMPRMLATFADALQHRGLLDGRHILPLPSGEWGDRHMFGLAMEELAFKPLSKASSDDERHAIEVAGEQLTRRYVLALDAKREGKYPGRAILRPSEMLGLLE